MFTARVDLEFRVDLPTEPVLRQHAPHGRLDHPFGMRSPDLGRRKFLQATPVPGVALVDLTLFLSTAEYDLLGIDHHDVVAGVEMRRIGRLILAAQNPGDLDRKAAQNLAFRINHNPLGVEFGNLR